MRNIFNDRLIAPIKVLLSQGLSPKKLALALAAGCVLGVTPMLGISTLLAVLVAYVLGLNQVGIQIGNYAMYPLQILLFIPFIRAGEWLTGITPVTINPVDIAMMFTEDVSASISTYGASIASGVLVWLLLAVPMALLLRYPLQWIIRAMGNRAAHR